MSPVTYVSKQWSSWNSHVDNKLISSRSEPTKQEPWAKVYNNADVFKADELCDLAIFRCKRMCVH